ncbi:MAG: hypothetical protein M3Q49_16740 [Actinomycetota bacterium]|jgi:hypothetical protein|nr:hypothetical protein [Actinomycetota bacterium]
MNAEERRKTSRAFAATLRAKWAASREGLRLEDLMGRDRGEEDTAGTSNGTATDASRRLPGGRVPADGAVPRN